MVVDCTPILLESAPAEPDPAKYFNHLQPNGEVIDHSGSGSTASRATACQANTYKPVQ